METDRDGEEDEEEEKKRGDGIGRSVSRVVYGVYGVTLCVKLTLSLSLSLCLSLSIFTPSSLSPLFPPPPLSFSLLLSPSLTPLLYLQVCVKVTLLNFAITPQGLEEQLLGALIKTELPEVEEANATLVLDNARMKKVRGRI
jgi:hypothetical protein